MSANTRPPALADRPVEETVVELGVLIATAENPTGPTRGRTRGQAWGDAGESGEDDRKVEICSAVDDGGGRQASPPFMT